MNKWYDKIVKHKTFSDTYVFLLIFGNIFRRCSDCMHPIITFDMLRCDSVPPVFTISS